MGATFTGMWQALRNKKIKTTICITIKFSIMNKKLFLGMFAAAGMLLATSCSNDELDVVQSGNEAQVTFSLAAEGGIATRAISDGTGANVLHYAIYDANQNLITTISPETNGLFTKPQAFPNGSKQDEVSVTLAKGQEYTAVFWAQNSECTAYEVTAETDGLKVAVDYDGDNNDETRDAFFKAETFKVTGNAKIDVVLKRPFAQINVGVTEADWNAAVASGITISESKVVIKNVATSINLLTGEVGDETTAVTYDFASIPLNSNEVLKVDVDRDGTIDEDENYKYLSMSYILTDNDADKTTLEADGLQFTFKSGGEDIVFDEGLHSVPVQRNWRTNIIGKLLTGDIQFNIVIDERFDDDYNYPEFEEVTNGVKYDAATKTYYLYSVDGLKWLSTETNTNNNQFSGYTVKLTSDVDLNGVAWAPIGMTNAFLGTFDGGNNTISNLTVNVTDDNNAAGLFASARKVMNVKMNNVKVSGHYKAGAIVGNGLCAIIENCHVDGGSITSTPNSEKDNANHVGGIVGYLYADGSNAQASVKNCSVKNLTITAYRDVAGIAGTIGATNGSVSAEVSDNIIDNVTIIANQLAEYCESGKDANAGKEFGRKAGTTEKITVSNNSINNVEVVVLAFDENGVLELPSSATALNCVATAVTLGNDFEGKTVKLTGNIDLSTAKTNGNSNAPIGSSSNDTAFRGTFDGDGHTISNLYQSGWDLSYDWYNYGSVGLFAQLDDATVKNLTLDGFEGQIEGGDIAFVAGSATGDCTFENIEIKNGKIGTYNNGIGSIIGWSGSGNYTFKNIKIGADVVLGGLWGSFDSSVGGIVGQAEAGASYTFENVEINCRLDVYNDCTASYDYYLYRMCGMIIGRCKETTTIDGKNYPDLSKYNITCTNVTVNYGDWMNYHYCEPTPGYNNGRGMRVEPGYAYDGLPADFDHSQCTTNHMTCIPFDGLFGGDQLGVNPVKTYDGVTVNYPESYNAGE